ncbi:hypothetical protein HMPREF0201_03453 [Cedecea davisae DSM 4568]|uniref:Uncharacterized protein n=1 Tax=Cedecea davisae DSM 4568 TaxID=566551 RepID=S3J5F8_9ENTR|nr:hypothetical protein HMPREF0201_03453 [Cedecea davisae DSM 4568]
MLRFSLKVLGSGGAFLLLCAVLAGFMMGKKADRRQPKTVICFPYL